MTDKEDRDIKEVNMESNDIGTEGGKSWDYCSRITIRSSEQKDTLESMIKKAKELSEFVWRRKKDAKTP